MKALVDRRRCASRPPVTCPILGTRVWLRRSQEARLQVLAADGTLPRGSARWRPLTQNPAVHTGAPPIRELAKLSFLDSAENLLLLAPAGTGKTYLSIALGIRASAAHERVLIRPIADLLNELLAPAVDHTLSASGRGLALIRKVKLVPEAPIVGHERPYFNSGVSKQTPKDLRVRCKERPLT